MENPAITSKQRLAAAAILLAAAVFRLYGLGSQPVWCDESYFWICASHPGWLSTLLHTMADDVYPPLFFLLLHFIGFFTSSVALIRLPMALAGIASVAVLMALVRRFSGIRTALFAGALAAVSPVLIYYSQEFKMYSILALMLLLLFDESAACLQDPGRGWGRLALWAVLSVYTFYLALLVWFCLLGLAWWETRSELRRGASIWKGFGIAGLAFLPWLPFFIKSVVVNQGSVQNFFMDRIMLYSLQNFSVGFWAPLWLAWGGMLVFGAVVLFGLFKARQEESHFPGLLAGLSFLPLGSSWLASVLAKPTYSDRAMLVCAFGWLALAAYGLARMPRRASWIGFALLMGLSLFSLGRYESDPSCQRVAYRPAWDYVVQNWQPGDSIFHSDIFGYYPFKFYALQEARDPSTSAFHDEPGAALSAASARVPGLRPDWIYREPPAFSPSKAGGIFRSAWRVVNAWLTAHGVGLYTGYNRDFVSGQRFQQEALPGLKRIWYVSTDEKGVAQSWLPQINVYRHGVHEWVPFEPEKLEWLKGFHVVDHQLLGQVDVFLLEKNGKRK